MSKDNTCSITDKSAKNTFRGELLWSCRVAVLHPISYYSCFSVESGRLESFLIDCVLCSFTQTVYRSCRSPPGTYRDDSYPTNTPLFNVYSSSSDSKTGVLVHAAAVTTACGNTEASGTAFRSPFAKGMEDKVRDEQPVW